MRSFLKVPVLLGQLKLPWFRIHDCLTTRLKLNLNAMHFVFKEAGKFKDMVDKLQEIISKRCDEEGKKVHPIILMTRRLANKWRGSLIEYSIPFNISDENEKLKTEIAQLKDKLRKIEEVTDVPFLTRFLFCERGNVFMLFLAQAPSLLQLKVACSPLRAFLYSLHFSLTKITQ